MIIVSGRVYVSSRRCEAFLASPRSAGVTTTERAGLPRLFLATAQSNRPA